MHLSEYMYPLNGGLMLGSCVYHLLHLNGKVLGISGIYGSAISRAISIVGLKLSQMSTSAETTVINAPDTSKEDENDQRDGNWQIAFTLGMMFGGILLRTFRPYLERSLGIPLFDAVGGDKNSIWFSLSTFLVGLLVGVGTKVAK